jgi:hypothetical protein
MTEFSEKKPEDKTFQLSGLFCFYSRLRAGNEYDTDVYKKGYGAVTVNYYGTLLSDGTPGGIAGNEFVRPDQPETYILVGKVIPNSGGDLEEVNLEKEIRLQLGLPDPVPAAKDRTLPAKEQPGKTPDIMEQFEQQRKKRKAFDKKSNARMKQYKNKFTPKKK